MMTWSDGYFKTENLIHSYPPAKDIKKDIIEILIKHPEASREYIATQTNRSAYTIKDHLKWLILNYYIKRVGREYRYSGYWEIL